MSAPASSADCLSDQLAAGYVDDVLDAPARAKVDAHLAGCASCRWLVATLAQRAPILPTVAGAAGPEVPGTLTGTVLPTGPAMLPPPSTGEIALGTLIGRYQIVRRVGAGGMGTVYAAHDPVLRREVAIKLLLVGGRRRTEAQARLLREAHAMARLSHPGVVPIHDVGTFGGGVFLTMELVDGQDARRWLAETRPTWKQALAVLIPVGRGLAAAHAAGIVHRDVKPANVLIGRDGRGRITDFGLAITAPRADDESSSSNGWRPGFTPAPPSRRGHSGTAPDPGRRPEPDASMTATSDESEDEGVSSDAYLAPVADDAPLTREGTILGTPMYMAPEQHQARRADARADQFSFCVLLYEAVYGQRPFAVPPNSGPFPAVALAGEVLAGRVRTAPAGSSVPGWLRRILLRGLSPDPADRWPSMNALLDAIEDAPRRRRRPLIYAGAVAVAIGLGGAFTAGRSAHGEDTCRDGDRQLASAWAPDDRTAAFIRLAGLGSYGAATAPRLEAQVGDFAVRWTAGHRDACLAHRRGAVTDALYDRRIACLGRGRAALGAVADIVRKADGAAVPGAVLAVRALPDPAACADLDALLADTTAPPPALAGRAAAIDDVLERARVDIASGEYRAGRDLAGRAVADARALAHPPLLAEALLVEGHAAMNLDRAAAVPVLTEATSVALASGADAIAVEAWARRAWLRSVTGRVASTDAPLDGRDVVEALSARPSASGFARALLHNNLGAILGDTGQREAARPEYLRAIAEAAPLTGAEAVELLIARSNLALATDDPVARDALFAGAVSELTRLVGADHPLTLGLRSLRAGWVVDLARSRELLVPACRDYDAFHGARIASSITCWAEVGFIANELGDRTEAIAAMSRATDLQGTSGDGSKEPAGYLALWQGDARGAADWFRAAVARMPRHPDELWWQIMPRARLEVGLAQSLRVVGEHRAALTALDQAVVDLRAAERAKRSPLIARRIARALTDRVAALAATHAPPARIAAEAAIAATLLRAESGRGDEIAELDRLSVSR